MKNKVYWASRHALLDYQIDSIKEVHGENIRIIQENVMFQHIDGLYEYIKSHEDGYVYAVAGGIHYIFATMMLMNQSRDLEFYIFSGRPNTTLDFSAIYKVNSKGLQKVWEDKSSYVVEG